MTRLINADAYEHAVQGNPYVSDSVKTYVRCSIQSQPTIDAEPVKRGMWTVIRLTNKDYDAKECSSCGSTFFNTILWHYCPNCGCRMDKE